MRCCMNCEFHDEGYHNQCREPRSDQISDREAGNFCDWFKLADGDKKNSGDSIEDSKKKFDELFKK